nr:hypothetical protein [Halomicroarcula nitratireducens]
MENISGDLAVLGVVLLALVDTVLTRVHTALGEVGVVIRPAGHKTGVQGCEIGYVTAEAGTLFHRFVTETLVGAPFGNFARLVTVLDALALFVTQVVDLRYCFCKGHRTQKRSGKMIVLLDAFAYGLLCVTPSVHTDKFERPILAVYSVSLLGSFTEWEISTIP